MCPLCFGEKNFLAPVCATCTHEVPILMQILGWIIYKIGQLIGFIRHSEVNRILWSADTSLARSRTFGR
jgi:hypothetical protein